MKNKLWKKFGCAALSAALCLGLWGCGGEKPSGSSGSPESSAAELANPMKATDKSGLEAVLGIPMTEPEGAEAVKYYLIDGETAHIAFTLEGHDYIFRASKTKKDISGVYEEFEEEKASIDPGNITVQFTLNGGSLGQWSLTESKVNFTLYCADADVSSLCSVLYAQNTPEGERADL